MAKSATQLLSGPVLVFSNTGFGEFWFGLAEVRFGQDWSGSVEFGLVKVGVIWFSLILFGQSTDKQTN